MLPLLCALQSVAPDSGPTYSGLAKQLDARIPRFEVEAKINGVLDEPVWRRAARLTGFSQYRPVDGRPAEDSTEVLVWYAPDAIYFGIRAFEPHGNAVRATLADRDNIDADDHVAILLDTYLDHRRATMFAVNPLGVQEDGVWSDGVAAGAAGGPSAGGRFDATIDLNPDYVYESRGHVTDWGYEVEVRIPFKSLRYQSADPQDWGVQILRSVQHSGYEETWTPAVRANASFLIQSGRLVGLGDLRRGLVLDLTPEFTTKVDGAPTTPGYDYRGTPEVAGNLRWGVTQNLGLTATANPDFSQVEADIGQVTLNQRFALFYPEKRPFFLEGLEQFDTPNSLIYTRRIAQPVFGAKLAGKVGSMGIAYLGAVDNSDQSATGPHPVYNMLRLRRDLGPTSTLGIAYTDRIDGDDYNRVLGVDAHVVWRKIWFSEVQIAGAWTRDLGGVRAGWLPGAGHAQPESLRLRVRGLRGLHRRRHALLPAPRPVSPPRRGVHPQHTEPGGVGEYGGRLLGPVHLPRSLRGTAGRPDDRRRPAPHARAPCRGALGAPAPHPRARRQPLLDRDHPPPQAQASVDTPDLRALHRAVFRGGPGRAARRAYRAAAVRERGHRARDRHERLPERPVVLLQADAGHRRIPGLRLFAQRGGGVPVPQSEPHVGRVFSEAELLVPDVDSRRTGGMRRDGSPHRSLGRVGARDRLRHRSSAVASNPRYRRWRRPVGSTPRARRRDVGHDARGVADYRDLPGPARGTTRPDGRQLARDRTAPPGPARRVVGPPSGATD